MVQHGIVGTDDGQAHAVLRQGRHVALHAQVVCGSEQQRSNACCAIVEVHAAIVHGVDVSE